MRRELREAGFDKQLVEANLKGLEKLVTGLEPPGGATEWSDYGATCSYSDEDTTCEGGVRSRRRHAAAPLPGLGPGCNDGRYSRIASEGSAYTIALDADHGVVDRLYRALRHEGAQNDPAAGRRRRRPVTRASAGADGSD